MHYMLDKDHFL